MRRDYTVALEIECMSPLTHGAGAKGNEMSLRTREFLVDVPDPDMPGKTVRRTLKVPIVSGASFRSTLREHAVGHMAETLGLEDGCMSKDALRLLLKGGKNDSSGQSVSLDDYRELRELFPLLAIFGSMDGGLPIRGLLKVSEVTPFCEELLDAGLLDHELSTLQVSVDGEALTSTETVKLYEGKAPEQLHQIRTTEQYYRHDMKTSPQVRLLEGTAAKAIEDKRAEVAETKKSKPVKAKDRREANESMPHAYQAIKPGTRMVATLRLQAATQIEWECLAYAIMRWVQHGAILGGAASKGHGRTKVRIAGALSSGPLSGATSGTTALSVEHAGQAYLDHLAAHAEAIRERVSA